MVVVDSYSTDRTVELALGSGARVLRNHFLSFADQRNFGLCKGALKHEWVLHLDADEVVTEELRDEMLIAVNNPGKEAYQVASRLMFHGQWLKYSGLYPWYQVRLGRRSSLTFVQVGHGQRENLPAEKIGTLNAALLHYSFSKGLHDWVEKHNRYSTDEARHFLEKGFGQATDWPSLLVGLGATQRRRALKQLFFHLPCRPLLRFLYMYFIRFGFFDGLPGYHYCRLLAIYEYMIVIKTKELRRRKLGLPV